MRYEDFWRCLKTFKESIPEQLCLQCIFQYSKLDACHSEPIIGAEAECMLAIASRRAEEFCPVRTLIVLFRFKLFHKVLLQFQKTCARTLDYLLDPLQLQRRHWSCLILSSIKHPPREILWAYLARETALKIYSLFFFSQAP